MKYFHANWNECWSAHRRKNPDGGFIQLCIVIALIAGAITLLLFEV